LTDAFKLKSKILKILKILKIEEFESKNKEVKFALKLTPFEIKNFIVVVEYFPKVDMIRVSASVGIGKNLRETYKEKNQAEKMEIMSLFAKSIRARNFNVIISEDFAVLEGHKMLIQQNMSGQMLLDTVTEAVFVLQDLWELLYQADQSLKAPQISEASKNMFQ